MVGGTQDSAEWQHWRPGRSSSTGTVVRNTDELTLPAWRTPGRGRRASEVRRAISDPGRGQTSKCRWRRAQQRSTRAVSCPLLSLVRQQEQCCSNQSISRGACASRCFRITAAKTELIWFGSPAATWRHSLTGNWTVTTCISMTMHCNQATGCCWRPRCGCATGQQADYIKKWVWWCGVVVSVLASINEVNLHRARLVLRWATVSGFNSGCPTLISVCNQPATTSQLSLSSLRGR